MCICIFKLNINVKGKDLNMMRIQFNRKINKKKVLENDYKKFIENNFNY